MRHGGRALPARQDRFLQPLHGVAEDEEIDRVGDLEPDRLSIAARGAGAPVTVGWMQGRSRAFVVDER